MADFPPNLDDGELWLPSDMFPDEVTPSKFSPHNYSELTYVEVLARRFAALALLERRQNQTVAKCPLNLAPDLERFRPPVRHGSTGYLPAWYFAFNGGTLGVGHGINECGTGRVWTGSRPVYRYQFLNPVQPQVEGFLEARTRVSQRQHNRILQNRVLPFQGSGVEVGGGGGFVREYGGTGVFLPRIATTTTTTTSNVARKRQSVRNRQDTEVIPQRNSIKRVDVGKQEECHYQLPPEMGLPQDWTY